MEWAQHNADDLGLSLAVDMTQMELVDFTQMRRLLADLLTRAPVQGVPRVWAYITAAWLAHLQGDYVEADKLAQTSVPLARRIRDAEVLAFALYQSSATLVALGKVEAARESIEEAAGLVEGSANSRLVSVIKSCVALVATQSGDYAAAFAIQAEAIALARAEGVEMNVAACLDNLAWAQLGMNDQGAAAISWKEALLTFRTLNDFVGLMYCLEGLSCVASARGDHQRALRLAAAVTRGSAERSLSFEPWIRAQFDENVHLSRSRLGVRKSEDAWNQGWVMTIDQAVDYALSNVEPKSLPHANPLSRREHEVVTLVAQGMTNRQIAERLFIAERSAEGHLERIRNKLGVRSRTEVATWAVEHGLREAPIQEKGTRRGSPSS
jgi:non-specific serine/threonine protein kinase